MHHMNSNVPIPCVCMGKAGVFCLSFFDAECDPNSQIPTISAFPPPSALSLLCSSRVYFGKSSDSDFHACSLFSSRGKKGKRGGERID